MNKEISNVKPVSEEEEKAPGIFQKIFYIIIIPLLFVIALLLIVAQFSGTNVFEKVTEWIPKAETETPTEETFQHQSKIVALEADIQEKEAQLLELQQELDEALLENQQQIAIQEDLKKQIRELQAAQTSSKKEFNEIVSTYEQMTSKKAAAILVEMNDEEALKILSNLKPNTLSSILSKMDPSKAAHFTEQLSKGK